MNSSYRWVILIFGILAYATSHFARQNYIYLTTGRRVAGAAAAPTAR